MKYLSILLIITLLIPPMYAWASETTEADGAETTAASTDTSTSGADTTEDEQTEDVEEVLSDEEAKTEDDVAETEATTTEESEEESDSAEDAATTTNDDTTEDAITDESESTADGAVDEAAATNTKEELTASATATSSIATTTQPDEETATQTPASTTSSQSTEDDTQSTTTTAAATSSTSTTSSPDVTKEAHTQATTSSTSSAASADTIVASSTTPTSTVTTTSTSSADENDSESSAGSTSTTPDNNPQTSSASQTNTTSASTQIASNVPTSTLATTTTAQAGAHTEVSDVELASTSTPDTSATTSTSSATTTTRIKTGDAITTANLINLVNSNFINAEGALVFLDLYGNEIGTIDLRNAASTNPLASCNLESCNNTTTSVVIANDATIDNNLYLIARTGGNTIEGAKNASIETGSAYANANVINVANTNIVDSKYLLAILNSFNDLNHDIVFPSLYSYLTQNANSSSASTTFVNGATVNNEVTLAAHTGSNTASTTGSNRITTGSAATGASIFNQINTSLTGGDNVSILFRVGGTWSGNVYGLPDNASWVQTANGYVLHIDNDNTGGPATNTGRTTVYATNTASINNRLEVAAMTGENTVNGAETALIATGDAYAGANIVNIANGNVVGRNWLMAVVNILGDFNGDIAFGRPDLWVGGMVNMPNDPENGDTITYTHTIKNNGDSPANNVRVTDSYSQYLKPQASSEYTIDESANTLTWNIGKMNPGEVVDVSYQAAIVDAGVETNVSNTIEVSGVETDNNLDDNVEVLGFYTRQASGGSSYRRDRDDTDEPVYESNNQKEITEATFAPLAALQITREPKSTVLSSTDNITVQTLTLHNPTDQVIPNVTLTDILEQNTQNTHSQEVWFLGNILPREELVITYTLAFKSEAPAGTYHFSTRLQNENEQRILSQNGTLEYLAPQTVPIRVAGSATAKPATPSLAVTATNASATQAVQGLATTSTGRINSIFPVAQAAESVNQEIGPLTVGTLLQFGIPLLILYLLYRFGIRSRRLWP